MNIPEVSSDSGVVAPALVKVPSPEEQVEILLQKLAGHAVFGRCRGSFHDLPYHEFLEEPTPTAASAAFEAWYSDRRVMLSMLAKLKRDGHTVAFQELSDALGSRHIFTGEVVPIEERQSAVLVMCNPSKALLMARWIYTSTWEDGCDWYKNGFIPEQRSPCGSLTSKLFEAFPGIGETFFKTRHPFHGPKSPSFLFYDSICRMQKRLTQVFKEDDVKWVGLSEEGLGTFSGYPAFGYLVNGAKNIREVKRLFARQEQKELGFWEFAYPAVHRVDMENDSSFSGVRIGFHPESEHEEWRKRWPAFVSCSAACGYGVVLMVDDKMYGRGLNGVTPYTSSLDRYPHKRILGMTSDDLMRQRLVLRLQYHWR